MKKNTISITPVILCGGSGNRLWPLSRNYYPKQFINLVSDQSLFADTIERIIELESREIIIDQILIVTNENHRFLALHEIQKFNNKIPFKILLEPTPKNTSPALTFAALEACFLNSNSILIVLPSDHYVKNKKKFVSLIHKSLNQSGTNSLFMIGIKPTRPEIGYGYIEFSSDKSIKKVLSFKEKPTLNQARKMIKNNCYAWNAGIFILKSSTWLSAIKLCNKKIHNSVLESWNKRKIDNFFIRPDENYFNLSPSDSIDYSVIENFKKINLDLKINLLDAGWTDLGSFDSLYEILDKDFYQNVIRGDVVQSKSSNNFVFSNKRTIGILGVSNLIIVETGDCILIANRNNAQSIKDFFNNIKKNHMHLVNDHLRVERPWGWFETLECGHQFKVKRIVVKPMSKLSYQSHKYRNEHWVVIKGEATIIKDGRKFKLFQDQSTYIMKGVKHQLSNQQKNDLEIIEVQTGLEVNEEDIVRYKDDYGRI